MQAARGYETVVHPSGQNLADQTKIDCHAAKYHTEKKLLEMMSIQESEVPC